MSHCFNPACSQPQNQIDSALCSTCGSNLRLQNRYYASRIIGQGGFGKTYLAVDEENSNPCVIKQFSFPSSSSTALRLFSDEAQQLQSLGVHEQIPTFIDYVEQQDKCFIIQEFVDGSNLEEELKANGAFTEAQVEELLLDILPIIKFIHEQGVIHRDIKPENIIRRKSDQRFVLVDFGAAKQATTTALAKTGTTIGSAGYTAPEQAFGKAVKQSDLYSLGVTSIHLLTGMHPFDLVDSSDGNWVWRDYLKRPVSQRLSKIIDKLLERGTKMRYSSAAEVLRDLKVEVNQKLVKKSNLPFPSFEKTVAGLMVIGLILGAAITINQINNALNLPTSERAEKVLTTPQSKILPVQTVEIWDKPLLIFFDKDKEIIAKAWLNDPTKVAIAINEKTGVINLQKLSNTLKPGTQVNLTVVTQNTNKEEIQHRIKIIAGSGKPKYEEVAIIDGKIERKSVAISPQLPERQKNDLQEIDKAFPLLVNVGQVLGCLIIVIGLLKSAKSAVDGEDSQSGLAFIVFGIISIILIKSLESPNSPSISSLNEQIQQLRTPKK